jgi:hypothetical protein
MQEFVGPRNPFVLLRLFREVWRNCPDEKKAERDCAAWEMIKEIVGGGREETDGIQAIDPPDIIKELARSTDGKINECFALPDGSGFATMSMPLPKDHWLLVEGYNEPPMPMKLGTDSPAREVFRKMLIDAGRYAVRASTMNGKEEDFDPDAMVGNFVIGMLGYYTHDGLSHVDDKEVASCPSSTETQAG